MWQDGKRMSGQHILHKYRRGKNIGDQIPSSFALAFNSMSSPKNNHPHTKCTYWGTGDFHKALWNFTASL